METRAAGRSGLRLSRLGLGCATFGREISQDESFRIMDYAVEHGITLFDTAEAYGGGQAREYRRKVLGVDDQREVSGEMHSSEKIIGRWLASRGGRRQITLLTKVTSRFTRAHVREALEASLERLRTDAVDLYLYHSFDPCTPVEEAAAAMDEVVAAGLARAGGCSNYTGAQLDEALTTAENHGLNRFEVVETAYSLVARQMETDLLPVCRRRQVGILTYSPLAAGFLLGKYRPGAPLPPGTRFDVIPGHRDVYFSERNFAIAGRLARMAERTGRSAALLAMAWVLRQPDVASVLVGARTTAHLDNALEALRAGLPDDWAAEMEAW